MKEAHVPKYMLQGSSRGCSVDGCRGRHVGAGFCMRHYSRIVRRKQGNVESPGDNNPESHERLTEDEYCRLKDFRAQGFKPMDVAFELEKNIGVIKGAWASTCFAEYLRPPEKPWPRFGAPIDAIIDGRAVDQE